MKTKDELQELLENSPKGKVVVQPKKHGRWIRYYLIASNGTAGSAYYTAKNLEYMIRQGQVKTII